MSKPIPRSTPKPKPAPTKPSVSAAAEYEKFLAQNVRNAMRKQENEALQSAVRGPDVPRITDEKTLARARKGGFC